MKHRAIPLLAVLSLVFSLLVACSSAARENPTKAVPPQASTATGQETQKGAPGSSADQGSPGQIGPMDRMIIYTANLTMVVKDTGQAMDAVTDIVNVAGGVIAGTKIEADPSIKDKDNVQNVYMTLRVPSTKYADVMSRLRKLAVKPPDENSSSQDVTEEYSDLEAQLRNLEVVEAQYQELMKKAVTIDEILKVQQKLGETRGQIERTKGRLIYLERRAEMATINLYLRPEIPGKDTKTKAWDPIKVALEAWEASLVFLQGIATVGIMVAVFFWWMLPLILLAIIMWRVWRNRRRPAVTPSA